MTQNEGKPPVMVLRDGPIKAAIWENEGESGSFLSTTFTKTYTKDGKPRDGHNFSRSDLLPLSELARKVYHKLALSGRRYAEDNPPAPDAD